MSPRPPARPPRRPAAPPARAAETRSCELRPSGAGCGGERLKNRTTGRASFGPSAGPRATSINAAPGRSSRRAPPRPRRPAGSSPRPTTAPAPVGAAAVGVVQYLCLSSASFRPRARPCISGCGPRGLLPEQDRYPGFAGGGGGQDVGLGGYLTALSAPAPAVARGPRPAGRARRGTEFLPASQAAASD